MTDVFTRLVSRAWDTQPRVRPQLAPRFAPRTAAFPLEEIEQEVGAPRGEPLDRVEPRAPIVPSMPRETPQFEERRHLQAADVAPDAKFSPSPPPLDAAVLEERDATPLTLERTIERIFQSSVERTRVVDAAPPVLAPPPSLRPVDVAILRPSEPRRASVDVPPLRPRASTPLSDSSQSSTKSHDPIHVSIGRIDVRATAAPARVAPASRPKVGPVPLDEYLRRRNEGR